MATTIDCLSPGCAGRSMGLLLLEETPGYGIGWGCDVCPFQSTRDPELPRSRHRFHCKKCSADLCILCGRKQAQKMGQTDLPQLPGPKPSELNNVPDTNDGADNSEATTDEGPPKADPNEEAPIEEDSAKPPLDPYASSMGIFDDFNQASDQIGPTTSSPDRRGAEAAAPAMKLTNRALESNLKSRNRPSEENSHAAWFAAAKQQWHSDGSRTSLNGYRSVVEVAEPEESESGAATIPTKVEVEIPSYGQAAAGHVVYTIKIADLTAKSNWVMLKRYSEFSALEEVVSRGFKYSKAGKVQKQMPKFPPKLFPKLDKRRQELHDWLVSVVRKVSLHLCDDEAARAVANFIGLRASAFLDAGTDELFKKSQDEDFPIFHLPHAHAPVHINRNADETQSEHSNWQLVSADPSPSTSEIEMTIEPIENNRIDVKRTQLPTENKRLSSSALLTAPSATSASAKSKKIFTLTDRLREANTLFSEGLIGASDYDFAKKHFIEGIAFSSEPVIQSLRIGKRAMTDGLISQIEYNEIKRKVLSTSSSPSNSPLASSPLVNDDLL